MFTKEQSLLETMRDTNTKLSAIKALTISSNGGAGGQTVVQQDNQTQTITDNISVIRQGLDLCNNRITHIEAYLEANDVEGDTTRDFVLQAQS